MRVLFYDIDGVLNTSATPNPRDLPYITDPRLVARFKTIIFKTRATPVMISTWRYDPAGLFSARHQGIPCRGVTPDLPNRPRRDEIVAWLRKHPRVTRFAVLDDDDDDLDALPLFQPSAHTGLTSAMAKAIEAYLLGKSDHIMRRNKLIRLLENTVDAFTGHKG
jgi:hypothetical protein